MRRTRDSKRRRRRLRRAHPSGSLPKGWLKNQFGDKLPPSASQENLEKLLADEERQRAPNVTPVPTESPITDTSGSPGADGNGEGPVNFTADITDGNDIVIVDVQSQIPTTPQQQINSGDGGDGNDISPGSHGSLVGLQPLEINEVDAYGYVSELYPNEFSYTDGFIIVPSLSLAAGLLTSVPTYFMGSIFIEEFLKSKAVDPETRFWVDRYFAVVNVVVNAYIYTQSLTLSFKEIRNKIISNISGKKAGLAVASLITLSVVGAIPTIHFVDKYSDKSWSIGWLDFMRGVTLAVNTMLNFRGIMGFEKYLVGRKNISGAQHFRRQILNALNQCLIPEGREFEQHEIEALAKGNVTIKHHAILQGILALGGAGVTYPYSKAFYYAAKDVIVGALGSYQSNTLVTSMCKLIECQESIPFWSGSLKFLLLGRTSFNLVNLAFDTFVNTTIGGDRTSRQWKFTLFNLFFAVCSLTSSAQIVKEKIYGDDEDMALWSLFWGSLAAFAINFKDLNSTNKNIASHTSMFFKKRKNKRGYTQDRFAEDPYEFIRNAMINVAKMSDTEVLRKFTQIGKSAYERVHSRGHHRRFNTLGDAKFFCNVSERFASPSVERIYAACANFIDEGMDQDAFDDFIGLFVTDNETTPLLQNLDDTHSMV